LERQRHGEEMVVSDYDLVVIGGGFAGAAAALIL
jgi:succinate dehydrogenase/fumarate reductase flavoprotein subunit